MLFLIDWRIIIIIIIVFTSVFPCLHGLDGSPQLSLATHYWGWFGAICFYWPDALPDAKPSISRYARK